MASQTATPPAVSAADLKAQAKAAKAAEKAAKKAGGGGDAEGGKKKGGKKKIIIIVAIVVVAVAIYMLKFRGGGDAPPPPPEPGIVVQLDPIYINLTDSHYLKLGLALQASAAAPKELEGAKALDLAIDTFSGKTMAELGSSKTRGELKETLVTGLEEAYEGEVLDVYFTEFVMQ
jgi:flagellar protein FliL